MLFFLSIRYHYNPMIKITSSIYWTGWILKYFFSEVKVLICITSDYSFKRTSQVASAIYYAVSCWLSVETRTVQIIKIHREYPNFILARSVNSLPELLARNKADLSFISQLPSICLRIMLIRSEMTSSRDSPE